MIPIEEGNNFFPTEYYSKSKYFSIATLAEEMKHAVTEKLEFKRNINECHYHFLHLLTVRNPMHGTKSDFSNARIPPKSEDFRVRTSGKKLRPVSEKQQFE